MQIWIDNTGLHGAGRCLFHQARTGYDVRGLLQFATLLIFAENLQLGDYEAEAVAFESEHFRAEIVALGLEPPALTIKKLSYEDYAAACRRTAGRAIDELASTYQPDERQRLGLSPLDIPRGSEFSPQRTRWLATEANDGDELARINQEALIKPNPNAIEFMLTESPGLRGAVGALINENAGWSDYNTFELEAFLRARLNDALSGQVGAVYAPAVHRGELIRQRSELLLQKLSDGLDEVVNGLRPTSLGIPSVYDALLQRSHGEPRGLVIEALDMRSRAAPLRRLLRELQDHTRANKADDRHKIQIEIRKLCRQVRYDLGIEAPPRLVDALSIHLVVGIPSASLNPAKLLEWIQYRIRSRDWAVLTDISMEAVYSGDDHREFATLVKRSMA